MRLSYLIACFGISIFACLFALPVVAHAQVIINEVMADPATTSDKSEWVELFNTSESVVDLRGWSLDGKLITSAQSVNIPANGYYIVTKTLTDFTTEFGSAANVFELAISLTNSGKTLTLTDGTGYTDTVTYGAASPSVSWERKGPLCTDFVKHPSAHSVNSANVGVSSQCYPQVLSIDKIEFSTDGVNWAESISVLGPIDLQMRYSTSGTATVQSSQWMMWDNRSVISPAQIAYYPEQVFKLSLQTNNGSFNADSKSVTIFPKLVINEFMPNPDGDDAGQEWVELFNPTNEAVNLNQASLRDASGEMLAFATDTVIPANGYLVATLPASKMQNCQKPAVCVDEIDLYFKELLVDQVKYDDSRSGQSWSRDGSGAWTLDWSVTAGTSNLAKPKFLPTVQISEIFPSPKSTLGEEEWIELYNFGDLPVSLSKWQLQDLSSSHTLGDMVINPHQHLVLTGIGISLNNGGDDIKLLDADLSLVDELKYESVGISYAAMRDWVNDKYATTIQVTAKPTSGLRNFYLAELPVETVTVEVPVETQSTKSAEVMGTSVDLGSNANFTSPYSLPSTEIHKLPSENQPVSMLILWPLFLMLVLLSVGLLGIQLYAKGYWLKFLELLDRVIARLKVSLPKAFASE